MAAQIVLKRGRVVISVSLSCHQRQRTVLIIRSLLRTMGRGGLAIVGTVVEIVIEQTSGGGVTRLDLVVVAHTAPPACIQ